MTATVMQMEQETAAAADLKVEHHLEWGIHPHKSILDYLRDPIIFTNGQTCQEVQHQWQTNPIECAVICNDLRFPVGMIM